MTCRTALLAAATYLALAGLDARRAQAHRGVDEQIVELDRVIQAGPVSAGLYLRRAELHRIHRDWEAARADYQSAYALAPDLLAVTLAHGRMSQESGRADEALQHLDSFLRTHPDHVEARIIRARALLALARYDEAVTEYERASASAARAGQGAGGFGPDQILEQARALTAAGRYVQALKVLDDGLNRLGQPVTLQLYAIDVERHLGDYRAALMRADLLPEARHNRVRWFARRAEILAETGRIGAARDSYRQALDVWQKWPSRRRQTRAAQRLRTGVERSLHDLARPHHWPLFAPLRPWVGALESALSLLGHTIGR